MISNYFFFFSVFFLSILLFSCENRDDTRDNAEINSPQRQFNGLDEENVNSDSSHSSEQPPAADLPEVQPQVQKPDSNQKKWKLDTGINLNSLFNTSEPLVPGTGDVYLVGGRVVHSEWFSDNLPENFAIENILTDRFVDQNKTSAEGVNARVENDQLFGVFSDVDLITSSDYFTIHELTEQGISSRNLAGKQQLDLSFGELNNYSLFNISNAADARSSMSLKPIFEYDTTSQEFLDLGLSGSVTVFFE